MNTRVKQILSALCGMAIALGLVWGLHTYLQSRNASAPKLPVVAAKPKPAVPAPPKPVPTEPTADELVAQAEAIRESNSLEALALYTRALIREPKHPFARSGLVHVLTARQDFEGLVTIYTAFLKKEPTNTKYLYNLAVTQTRLREFLDAEATYERLLTIDGENQTAWANYAYLLSNQGKYSVAIAAWRELAKVQTKRKKNVPSDTWLEIGHLQLALKQTNKAKAAFLNAMNLSDDLPWTRMRIADMWSDVGHHDMALVHIRLAIQADATDANLWREKGMVFLRAYAEVKDKTYLSKAIESWKTSLRLNPKQSNLKKHLTAAEKKLAEMIVSDATK